VPVEDEDGQLVGLITHRDLLHLLARGAPQTDKAITVRDLMKVKPLTVSSDTPTLEALDKMQRHRIGCLPVVDDGHLVGILTSYDFLAGAARLFRESLGQTETAEPQPNVPVKTQHASA